MRLEGKNEEGDQKGRGRGGKRERREEGEEGTRMLH